MLHHTYSDFYLRHRKLQPYTTKGRQVLKYQDFSLWKTCASLLAPRLNSLLWNVCLMVLLSDSLSALPRDMHEELVKCCERRHSSHLLMTGSVIYNCKSHALSNIVQYQGNILFVLSMWHTLFTSTALYIMYAVALSIQPFLLASAPRQVNRNSCKQ